MDNYNFRAHAVRRVKGGFRENAGLPSASSEAMSKFVWGQEQLKVIERQSIIGQLFPEDKSIMQTHSQTETQTKM